MSTNKCSPGLYNPLRCFRPCLTQQTVDDQQVCFTGAGQAQPTQTHITQPSQAAHLSGSQQQAADKDVIQQLPSPFASNAASLNLDSQLSLTAAPEGHEFSFHNSQVVVADAPVLQSRPSCPVQHSRPTAGRACRMPSRGDSAADTALDKAITPALLQNVSQGTGNGTWPLPKLVNSPIKAGPPVITDTPVILETEEISDLPDTCPMSSHYSPPSHGHSMAQDDQSMGQLNIARDQAQMIQRTVSFDQRSISSEQRRSRGSHGGGISSGAPPSEAGSASPNASLYDKLGGPEALETAVDMFYDRVLDDESLKHFFNGTNMMRLVIKQVQFMVYAFGGSKEYKGKDLRAAHYHLVKNQGLNTSHFDMVAGHFKGVLLELGVAEAIIDEAMQTLGSVRSSFDPKSYVDYTLPVKTKVKASVLKDPTAVDTLATLIPASKAEEALVRKAGSKGVVMAAVRVFYMRVMNDEILRPFFEDIDLARLKNKLVSFLAYAFGGGVGHQLNFQPKYKGRDLAFMHSHMIDKGLSMEHFDLVLRHFCQTLRQLNMPQSAIDEATVNLNKTRAAFQHVIDKAKDPNANPDTVIPTDLIVSMHGDKAALLAEVQNRMATNPEICNGIGLEFAATHEDVQSKPKGSCPYG